MRAALLSFLAFALCLMAFPAAGLALGGVSAWPYKSSEDSGTYTVAQFNGGYDAFSQPFGSYARVEGYDPCVFDFNEQTPPPLQPNTVQQYAVQGCVPQFSPWIVTKPWATHHWDLICPASAPYSYDSAYFSDQGVKESSYQTYTNTFTSHPGPSPLGQTGQYSTNFAFKTHSWAWSSACSATPQWWEPLNLDPVAGWKYSGATGGPSGSIIAPSNTSQSLDDGPRYVNLAVKATRGPRLRSARVDAKTILRTAEVDLVPNAERRHRLTCPKGYAPLYPRHGIGWYTPKPPKASLRNRVDDTPKVAPGRRGIEVHVVTRNIPRDTVRLQISVDCVKKA